MEQKVPRMTVRDLQDLIERGDDHLVEILPDGTIASRDGTVPRQPLTKRRDLGGDY